jgi:DNA-binding MarR family transcriptional regulator
VRRTGRLLTRRYEEALRPAGVTSAQFELMITLRAAGASSQGKLAELLEADQTTLSRNLKLLLQRRWIEALEDGRDGRRRTYRLTASGLAVLPEAQRCWRQAQEEMERRLGGPMAELWPALDRILSAARRAA